MAKPGVVPMFLQICHIQPNPTSFEINNSNQLSRGILSISRIQVPSTSGLANLRNKFETKCLSGKVLRIYHKCPNGWHQKKLTSRPRNYGAAGVVADRFIPFNVLSIALREMSLYSELFRSVFLNTQYLSIFSPNPRKYEKMRTKITLNTGTFYLFLYFWISCKLL